MLNFVVADNNLHSLKILINYLSLKNKNLKLLNICTNGHEVVKTLKNNNVDILILDLKIPILNGIQTLSAIKDFTNLPYIFITSVEDELIQQVYSNELVSDFFTKPLKLEEISYKLGNIIIDKEINQNKKYLITEELKKLSFSLKHIGTTYIIDAIMLIYSSPSKYLVENLEKNVYKTLAVQYSKTIYHIFCHFLEKWKKVEIIIAYIMCLHIPCHWRRSYLTLILTFSFQLLCHSSPSLVTPSDKSCYLVLPILVFSVLFLFLNILFYLVILLVLHSLYSFLLFSFLFPVLLFDFLFALFQFLF